MRETIQDELIMLLGYETDGGRHSVLWDYPQYFHSRTGQGGKELDQRFDDWMRTKRTMQKEELFDGMWKKIADHGYAFVLRFLPDGTFIEHNVSSEQNVGHGTWQQLGPVIRTWVGQMEGDQKAHYVLSMIPNKTGQIHSAVEQRNGRPNAYFKMIHLL